MADTEGLALSRREISWDLYRVAYQVAVSGSLNKAARVLGTSHATVLRDINRLEDSLNIKLFLRHQRGYQLSDAGRVLMQGLPDIQQMFSQLDSQMEAVTNAASGKLKITCLPDHVSLITPAIKKMRERYPGMTIRLLTTDEIISPAIGITHVSLRAGNEPPGSDIIARRLFDFKMGLYCHEDYIAERGLPQTVDEFAEHDWLLPSSEKQHIPFVKHVLDRVPAQSIVMQSNHFSDLDWAIRAGMGIGLMSAFKNKPKDGLVELPYKLPASICTDGLWFVYHRNYIGNIKIKALQECLEECLQPLVD
ncbi:LysR family transcriptional regulator [Pseudoteredinibacter isoporae]|uniref:DNA-binding transcriptional LysR family regulator n=1 Tax=Pseudoteredinibacter isoporae TaxID=570281 RepID=A0A7X0MXF0_9GAMM|nr:LysR family transcriptional regulator [Pseudoteredinibacter isoporae]MBB6523413.1 DNA-binding transcriptional LysR family regulator [Pseudoteredinibacter isoporae]NHO88924.1 LysR family transcriptional regulator [Pseudoteredinibacter isoporae]NIB24368.1 LysR family transcriptional regulator [Pseudoteredinibacter isoporae]